MTPAASAMRIVRSVPPVMPLAGSPSRTSPSRRFRRAGLVASSRRRSPSSTTGIEAAKRGLEGRVGLDVELDEGRDGAAGQPTLVEQRAQDVAGLVAEVAAGSAVQDEVGEGSLGHLDRIVGGVAVMPRNGQAVAGRRDGLAGMTARRPGRFRARCAREAPSALFRDRPGSSSARSLTEMVAQERARCPFRRRRCTT